MQCSLLSQRDFSQVIYNPGVPVDKCNLFIKFCELKINLTPSSFNMNFPSQIKQLVKSLGLASESRKKGMHLFCWYFWVLNVCLQNSLAI